MNYELTLFKAGYHGKAPTCARLSYMKLKLNNRAFQKCMVELAPQYETDQPSGSRTINFNTASIQEDYDVIQDVTLELNYVKIVCVYYML